MSAGGIRPANRAGSTTSLSRRPTVWRPSAQVVAIGTSAGGIEAFRLFFEAMPADTGMAFVVVLHMSADHKSALAEIIARWTAMPVTDAVDGRRVEPNQVYVIPPGYVGTLRQERCACARSRPACRARRRR